MIVNKLNTSKKLVKIVSNKVEKERINNVIKGVKFALNYISNKNVIYSDSEQDFSDFDSSERIGLKILTLDQMLNRLPITLAQLKAGNNSKKLKNEIRQLFFLCTDQRNLQRKSIKVQLTLFKNGNNLYEH